MTSYKLLKEHGTIEGVLASVEESNADSKKKKKFLVPDNFLYKESKELFLNPDVISDKEELQKQIVFPKLEEDELK